MPTSITDKARYRRWGRLSHRPAVRKTLGRYTAQAFDELD